MSGGDFTAALRCHVVAHQAFATRARKVTAADVEAQTRHLSAVQLDSITTVERSGRADLKTERKDGILRLRAFHLEPGIRRSARIHDAFERALARLAWALGLERVER